MKAELGRGPEGGRFAGKESGEVPKCVESQYDRRGSVWSKLRDHASSL